MNVVNGVMIRMKDGDCEGQYVIQIMKHQWELLHLFSIFGADYKCRRQYSTS